MPGREDYSLKLELDEEYFQIGDSLHDVIPVAIGDHITENEEGYEIFGIESPSRVLNEGYELENGVEVEDFAITSSRNRGEMVVGQVVSSNGKENYGNKPYGVIQAESFQNRLREAMKLESVIKNAYTVKTTIPRENVRQRQREIKERCAKGLNPKIGLEVTELDENKVKWNKLSKMLD
jgi:hypothetical protein